MKVGARLNLTAVCEMMVTSPVTYKIEIWQSIAVCNSSLELLAKKS